VAALKDLGVTGVDVCSLAKSRIVDEDELAQGRGYSGAARAREHQKAQGPSEQTRSPERVFLPNVKDPIVLRQNSPELLILTRARDEAHRFAITFHRQLRSKKSIQSAMDAVTGVGPEKKKVLLRHFGSVTQVKLATVEQLAAVEGVGIAAARKVFAQLHPAPAAAAEGAPPNKP
jgi:excinuclease ABC subunit C